MKSLFIAAILLAAVGTIQPAAAKKALILKDGASAAAATFSVNEALDALYYCKAAYCPYQIIFNWTCPTCTKHHTQFSDVTAVRNATTEFLGYAGYNPQKNEIVVAFRGTNNIENWIKDFDSTLTNYSHCDNGCQVHQGMYEVWNSVKPSLLNAAQTLIDLYGSASILVTGHSLGATVALYCALDITLELTRPTEMSIRLYTFGEPRSGDPNFAQFVTETLPEGKQFRVTHAADPVPHFPTESSGYLHAPHELWFNNNGNSTWSDCQDSATAEDPNCADSVLFPIDFYDHVMYLGHCTDCERQPESSGHCKL